MDFSKWTVLTAAVLSIGGAACAETGSASPGSSPVFSSFESPYYLFQYTKGKNWAAGKSVFEQDLQGHFAYMAQLETDGVLVHGGPIDRGDGEDIMGVIIADNLEDARAIILADPALKNAVHKLVYVNRWIAAAGSGDGMRKVLVKPVAP